MTEKDWKYLRSIEQDLLNRLCERINQKTAQIVSDATLSHHERYGTIYAHIQESDDIVADCFNGWSRSSLWLKLLLLKRHKLLTSEHVARLSPEMQRDLRTTDS